MSNKAILLLNLLGCYTAGAQKRYINLFNFLTRNHNDYFLIVNRNLFETLEEHNILDTKENVIIVDIPFFKNKRSDLKNHKKDIQDNKSKSRIRFVLGPYKTFFKMLYCWIVFFFQFRRIYKEKNIKSIYTVFTGGIWAWPLKYLYNFKLIHSYNDSTFRNVSKKFLKFFDSEYWVLTHCDSIDFLSKGLVKGIERVIGDLDVDKISITPNSFIDYNNYYSVYPKENNIVFIGRLHKTKNPKLFLQSIQYLYKNYKNTHLLNFYIFGEGPESRYIYDFINNNENKNIYFLGVTMKPWEYLQKSKTMGRWIRHRRNK